MRIEMLLHCPNCRDLRPVERPPCAEHTPGSADCPEWICLDCDGAILVGPLLPDDIPLTAIVTAA